MLIRSSRLWRFIAAHEFWLLWLYGAPLLLSSSLPLPVFLLTLLPIPLFWLARRMARGAFSVATPLDLPLAILLGMGLVGLLVSANWNKSLRAYGELVGGIALLYGVVNGLQYEHRTRAALAWLALAFGMAVVGLGGLNDATKFLPAFAWLNPQGFNPNVVAGAIAPTIPLAWSLGLFGKLQWRWRVLVLGMSPVMLVVILFTQSRGAWMGLAIALGVLLFWRLPRRFWIVSIITALVVLGAATWLRPSPDVWLEWLLTSDTVGGTAVRLELWSRALYILQDFPFTGIGIGTFDQVTRVLYPLFLTSPETSLPHAHNLYLQMGMDYGIPGLVAFIGVVTIVVCAALDTVGRTRNTPDGALAIGLFAGYVVYLIHGLTDAVTFSTKSAVVVWMLTGFLISDFNP